MTGSLCGFVQACKKGGTAIVQRLALSVTLSRRVKKGGTAIVQPLVSAALVIVHCVQCSGSGTS